MGIAQKVSRDFSDAVRSRGQSYFAKGRVAIISATAERGRGAGPGDGQVPGPAPAPRGQAARVVLVPVLRAAGEPCKHIWATVLVADARGLLAGGPGPPPEAGQRPAATRRVGRRASPAGPARPGPATTRPAARARPRPGPRPGPRSRPRAPGPVRARPGARPAPRPRPRAALARPRGRGRTARRRDGPASPRIDRLGPVAGEAAAASRGDGPARAKPVNRNTKRLLVYILDVPATLNQNQVVIDLARRQRRPGGRLGPARSPGGTRRAARRRSTTPRTASSWPCWKRRGPLAPPPAARVGPAAAAANVAGATARPCSATPASRRDPAVRAPE